MQSISIQCHTIKIKGDKKKRPKSPWEAPINNSLAESDEKDLSRQRHLYEKSLNGVADGLNTDSESKSQARLRSDDTIMSQPNLVSELDIVVKFK